MVKKLVKIIAVFVLIVFMAYIINFIFGTYTTHSFKNYLNDRYYSDYYAEKFMPQTGSLSDGLDISFTYQRKNHDKGLTANSYVLKVTYDEANYQECLSQLKNDYSYYGDPYFLNGFTINKCYDESFDYPRIFGMIGTNDDEHTIAYMFFVDEGNQNDDMEWILNEFFINNNELIL